MKRSMLRSDPEKTRAFVERGRERARERDREQQALGREGMASMRIRAPLLPPVPGLRPPAPPKRKAKDIKVPPGARNKALDRSKGICVVCAFNARVDVVRLPREIRMQLLRDGVIQRATQVHHVLPRNKWPGLIKLADNLIGVCVDCHMAHEYIGVKRRRIPRAALPACAIALADGMPKRERYLERTYLP